MPSTHVKCEKDCKEKIGGFCDIWYARNFWGWQDDPILVVTEDMICDWQQKI